MEGRRRKRRRRTQERISRVVWFDSTVSMAVTAGVVALAVLSSSKTVLFQGEAFTEVVTRVPQRWHRGGSSGREEGRQFHLWSQGLKSPLGSKKAFVPNSLSPWRRCVARSERWLEWKAGDDGTPLHRTSRQPPQNEGRGRVSGTRWHSGFIRLSASHLASTSQDAEFKERTSQGEDAGQRAESQRKRRRQEASAGLKRDISSKLISSPKDKVVSPRRLSSSQSSPSRQKVSNAARSSTTRGAEGGNTVTPNGRSSPEARSNSGRKNNFLRALRSNTASSPGKRVSCADPNQDWEAPWNRRNRGEGNGTKWPTHGQNFKTDGNESSETSSILPPPRTPLADQGLSSPKSPMSSTSSISSSLLPPVDHLIPNLASPPLAPTGSDGSREEDGAGSTETEPPETPKQVSSTEGLIPVEELFYRSTQPVAASTELSTEGTQFQAKNASTVAPTDGMQEGRTESDRTNGTTGSKISIARGRSRKASATSSQKEGVDGTERKHRRMVRRGMDMLVGGKLLPADPPSRSLELIYRPPSQLMATVTKTFAQPVADYKFDWAKVVTLNSDSFGPLLHKGSVGNVSRRSRELYLENFVAASRKWRVCPKDLSDIWKDFKIEQGATSLAAAKESVETTMSNPEADDVVLSYSQPSSRTDDFTADSVTDNEDDDRDDFSTKTEYVFSSTLSGLSQKKASLDEIDDLKSLLDQLAEETATEDESNDDEARKRPPSKGFGQPPPRKEKKRRRSQRYSKENRRVFAMEGGLRFVLEVTKAELESSEDGSHPGHVLRRVLEDGVGRAVKSESIGFRVQITKMILKEMDGGATHVSIEFVMVSKGEIDLDAIGKVAKRTNEILIESMDDGDLALAMANAAQAETGWPRVVRDRVVEEFLFESADTDARKEAEAISSQVDNGGLIEESEEGKVMERDGLQQQAEDGENLNGRPVADANTTDSKVDDDGESEEFLYAGGCDVGVFSDCSESSFLSSPFQGCLGPRLVDAVVERSLQRHPRVIAIGDVHGCVDELQALLRQCEYRPGDVVVFLGDLVCKGPDSISVVQMAREIGAIGVRGNHDFEVIRWHQAIKADADKPVVGSEHFRIALGLGDEDLKWLNSLPWYISSKELSALFVHAGFVSGIRLTKQNPRLMTNMRSILPDGTVTSKFFRNWPWARLWDGPQTVLFGHDADRGLQQYEHAIGLDTGCVYGGRLTACILPERRLVSVSAKREYMKSRRRRY